MLKEIRAYLRRIGANALIIAHDDEYQNEALSADKERLAYVTGFTGSAGMAIITPRQAVLFVDGRYVEQAKKQTQFKVLHVPRQTTIAEWFMRFLKKNYVVAYDPWTHSVAQVEKWAEIFSKRGATLVPKTPHPVDQFWVDRPSAKPVHTFVYPRHLAGKTTKQKGTPIKKFLHQNGWDALIVSSPDVVSWLLNKRSDAIAYSPLYLDRLIVWSDGRVVSFQDGAADLKGKVVALDPFETPIKMKQDIIKAGASVHHVTNPFQRLKAIKNKSEVQGMRQAGQLDSIALCEFLAGLEQRYKKETEVSVLHRLEMFRRQSPLYRENSFAPISASGKNAALPHYEATEKTAAKLKTSPLYLLDTGGQYWCGTTDMTRTVALFKPTALMKKRYTQVLKGHIALAKAVFTEGTSGGCLDILARQFLYAEGLDFDHGTGHGVGCFLNVHEAPPVISKYAKDPLEENMVVTDEPGFYLKGKFGIRIENMLLVQKDKTKRKGFLRFDVLTFIPFCDELIDAQMLSEEEKTWIGGYYSQIMEKVFPYLSDTAQAWIIKQVQKWLPEQIQNSTC